MSNRTTSPKTLTNYGFWKGFRGTTRGTELILRRPKLLFFMFLALLINGAIVGGLLWWGWSHSDSLYQWLNQQSSQASGGFFLRSWIVLAGWLKYLFFTLKIFVLILILYFVAPAVFTLLLNLNPASALLASEMFKYVFKEEVGVTLPEAPFVAGLVRMIATELRKLVVMFSLMFMALLFNLIPIIGSVVSVILLFIINVQFSGWSYITPYYEALEYDYVDQRTAMRRQRSMLWGLGLIASIPIFNFLAIFIGPVGGALLSAELHKELQDAGEA